MRRGLGTYFGHRGLPTGACREVFEHIFAFGGSQSMRVERSWNLFCPAEVSKGCTQRGLGSYFGHRGLPTRGLGAYFGLEGSQGVHVERSWNLLWQFGPCGYVLEPTLAILASRPFLIMPWVTRFFDFGRPEADFLGGSGGRSPPRKGQGFHNKAACIPCPCRSLSRNSPSYLEPSCQ